VFHFRLKAAVPLALSVIFITACGQKGALFLPEPAHQPNVPGSTLTPQPTITVIDKPLIKEDPDEVKTAPSLTTK